MMSETMKAKREELKAISAPFKLLLREGSIGSINEGLANYYAEQGHTTLNSYRRWQEMGFQVKKGSKALLMWGEPIEKKTKEEQKAKNEDEGKDPFYPLAYVFSNLQVEPLSNLSK